MGQRAGRARGKQDHEECSEPKERKWAGEMRAHRNWRDRRPNVERALEDSHCASEEEQGQEGKYWAKRNGEIKDCSNGEVVKGK